MTVQMAEGYRADINGLRAVSVVVVILYHAGVPGFTGGFVGVDVFFVISGYLIAQLLMTAYANGRYSYTGFLLRRLRRIFPALLFMLLATVPLALYLLPPGDLARYSHSLFYSTWSTSNYFFWTESGYFDRHSDFKPLLHTWSLGVEEQYYLLYPIVLVALAKTRYLLQGLWLIVIASFGLSVWGLVNNQYWPFFFLVSRVWELGLGAILALHVPTLTKSRWLASDFVSAAVVLLGLGLIICATVLFDDGTATPGVLTLVPTLGAVAVILGGLNVNRASALLGITPLVGIGLISYSLYLWHQPVLVFGRFFLGEAEAVSERWSLILLSVILAWLSWRYLESYFRSPNAVGTKPFLWLVALLLIVLTLSSFWLRHADPALRRAPAIPNGAISHTEFHQRVSTRFQLCQDEDATFKMEVWQGIPRCHTAGELPPRIAFLGDSHAEQLFVGSADRLSAGSTYLIRGGSPFIAAPRMQGPYRYLAKEDAVEVVIYSAFWNEKIGFLGAKNFFRQMIDSVEWLVNQGLKVILVIDTPYYSFGPEECLFYRNILEQRCTQAATVQEAAKAQYARLMNMLARHPMTEVVDLSDVFCSDDTCSMVHGDTMMYRDPNHLNWEGAQAAGTALTDRSRFLAPYLIDDAQ